MTDIERTNLAQVDISRAITEASIKYELDKRDVIRIMGQLVTQWARYLNPSKRGKGTVGKRGYELETSE